MYNLMSVGTQQCDIYRRVSSKMEELEKQSNFMLT